MKSIGANGLRGFSSICQTTLVSLSMGLLQQVFRSPLMKGSLYYVLQSLSVTSHTNQNHFASLSVSSARLEWQSALFNPSGLTSGCGFIMRMDISHFAIPALLHNGTITSMLFPTWSNCSFLLDSLNGKMRLQSSVNLKLVSATKKLCRKPLLS